MLLVIGSIGFPTETHFSAHGATAHALEGSLGQIQFCCPLGWEERGCPSCRVGKERRALFVYLIIISFIFTIIIIIKRFHRVTATYYTRCKLCLII